MPSARLRVQTSRWLETRRRQAQGRETSWLSVGGSQPLSSSAFPVNKSRPAGREPVEMVNELLACSLIYALRPRWLTHQLGCASLLPTVSTSRIKSGLKSRQRNVSVAVFVRALRSFAVWGERGGTPEGTPDREAEVVPSYRAIADRLLALVRGRGARGGTPRGDPVAGGRVHPGPTVCRPSGRTY